MNPVRQRVVAEVPPVQIVDQTTAAMVLYLHSAGFTDGDLKDISDRPPQGIYLRRGTTYVFISTYQGSFCEAVVERLDSPKQPKVKPSGRWTIARSLDDLKTTIPS